MNTMANDDSSNQPVTEPPNPYAAASPAQRATSTGAPGAAPDPAWERQTIEKLAFAALKEQKTSRRWGIFFKLATLAYVTILILMFLDVPALFKKSGAGERDRKSVV